MSEEPIILYRGLIGALRGARGGARAEPDGAARRGVWAAWPKRRREVEHPELRGGPASAERRARAGGRPRSCPATAGGQGVELLAAIRRVHAGESIVQPSVAARLIAEFSRGRQALGDWVTPSGRLKAVSGHTLPSATHSTGRCHRVTVLPCHRVIGSLFHARSHASSAASDAL